LVLGILRRALGLELYLTKHHFNNLSKLLLLMSLLWFYFTFAEYQTVWYGNEPSEMAVFASKIRGAYAPYFWTMVFCNFVVPFVLLGIRKLRTVTTAMISSVCVLIATSLDRYIIVASTLGSPPTTSATGTYGCTCIEVA